MHTTFTVRPGVNLARRLHGNGGKITKAWVRAMMKDHPEWDWYTDGHAINGESCLRYDASLVVDCGNGNYATIEFQSDDSMPFGYKAVVR